MRKKNVIFITILVLGCAAAASTVSLSKGKTEIQKKADTEKSALDFYYNYGAGIKDYAMEGNMQKTVISKKNIEAVADAFIQAGDERSKEDIVEGLEERQKRDQANYLKAVEEGFVVTDEEIEKAIEETKEAIKGEEAEKEIEAYCEGAGITMDRYWELQKAVYRKNYMIKKYMNQCQEDFYGKSEKGQDINGDFFEEFERISDENVKEFGVKVE